MRYQEESEKFFNLIDEILTQPNFATSFVSKQIDKL